MQRKVSAPGNPGAAADSSSAGPPYGPYPGSASNDLYNLLFCDDPAAFAPAPGQAPAAWQATLFSEPADRDGLATLAADAAREGRVRYLACARLREIGEPVPAKVLLGVIVEVALPGGLDALAAFAEGGVRYINQTGKVAVFEGVGTLTPHVQQLFAASEPVVARIGPWDRPRRSPPEPGNIRLTFLVSDGLCFGEGAMSVMQREPMAAPVIERATELLQTIARMAGK